LALCPITNQLKEEICKGANMTSSANSSQNPLDRRMKLRFNGNIGALTARLKPLALGGAWAAKPNGVWILRCEDRAGLLWSETRGTVWFDGPQLPKALLEKKVRAAFSGDEVAEPNDANDNTILLVRGRDRNARDELELVLRRLKLKPFVVRGDNLLEVLERQRRRGAQYAFAIVLITPDDKGYNVRNEKPEDAKPRARQDVIMAMGMLFASLTHERCAILQKGFVELPSNMGGVITIPFNNHVREAVPKLVQRLRKAGFNLDPRNIDIARG
jgi:predicted nucleotide-binding protein